MTNDKPTRSNLISLSSFKTVDEIEPEESTIKKVLWDEMNEEERKKATEEVLPYIEKQMDLVKTRNNMGKGRWTLPSFDWSCTGSKSIGSGWGGHHLCTNLLENISTCNFLSFGIARAYSFDKDLADHFNCHGFAADPTINHPSNLHSNITFHNIGANILKPSKEFKSGPVWWITSVPLLRKALGIKHINVLKMDCEGCEYALARDIARDDPTFFNHVDQFAVEIHLAKEWLDSDETFYYLGLLYKQLSDAGFRCHDVRQSSCSMKDERSGCFNKLVCGGINNCHNYLFAKI